MEINDYLKQFMMADLSEAGKYAEGRGISINVKNDAYMEDIKELIRIKFRN
jgi:hypothetical protein